MRRCETLLLIATATALRAAPPPALPGEDVTNAISRAMASADSTFRNPPSSSPFSSTWFDHAVKTWNAPPPAQQIAEEQRSIPLGKGAIFVPCMSKASEEPDIEILDSAGELVVAGKPSRSYYVLPGKYHVLLGSGSHRQRVVRTVSVVEGRTASIIADWSGLLIDVVNENNQPFRGQYELARIDEFDAFGRGYGRDPDLGEDLKCWILRPGIYKIFGVGESYNAITNFITVRLLPGELTRVVLVQNEDNMRIVSGGTIDFTFGPGGKKRWKWSIDIGGNALFTASTDHHSDSSALNTTATLLFNILGVYKRDPFEWTTTARLDEGVVLTGLDFDSLRNGKDLLRIRSLFVWRFLSWLGPYGRFFFQTGILPQYQARVDPAVAHYLILLKSDSTLARIDSVATSWRTEAAFSPLLVEAGIGTNADIFTFHFLEMRFRAGFGLKQEMYWGQWASIDTLKGHNAVVETIRARAGDSVTYSILLELPNQYPFEYGPETSLSAWLRLARWATWEAEARLFLPLNRLGALSLSPDVNLRSALSWHLSRWITLDYEYEYAFEKPTDEIRRKNLSTHAVNVRFSFNQR